MAIGLVVFDLAGTTITDNNFVARAFQNAFRTYDLEVSFEEINPIMGYNKPDAIQMVLAEKNYLSDQALVEHIHEEFVKEMLDFYEYSQEVKPMPYAEESFFYLKERGIKIALNTGFSKNIAQVIMNRMQWLERGLVDDFIASDEVEAGRPLPFMINTLKNRNKVSSGHEIMKVGDTVVDILEGKNAGCTYIVAATTGAAKRVELEQYHPTHIISSLSELPSIMKMSFQLHE